MAVLHAGAVPGLSEASAAYARALELDPERDAIARERAVVDLVLRREVPEAIFGAPGGLLARVVKGLTTWESTAQLDPDDVAAAPADVRRPLGLLEFLLGDLDQCERAWAGLDAADFPIVDGALGMVYLADGRPDRAYPRLERACEVFPDADFLQVLLADAALCIGELQRAEALLTSVDSSGDLTEPGRLALRRIRADLAATRGRTAAARLEYERLVEAQPDAPIAPFHLAKLELRTGEARSARRRLSRLVQRFPDVARFRHALAVATLEVRAFGSYLQQARYAVSADFGLGRSPGTVRDLLAILWDGGLTDLHARGVEVTGHVQPVDDAPRPTGFPRSARGPLSSRPRIEALLSRLAAFDSDAGNLAVGLPEGPERDAAEALAIGTRCVLWFPELPGTLGPAATFAGITAALVCRAHWTDLTEQGLPAAFDAVRRFGSAGADDHRLLHEFEGDTPGDMFGNWWSLALLPDVDGDGCAEVAVGAPQALRDPAGPGYVRVFSGRDGTVLHEFRGEVPKRGFGHSVGSAGDVDADGCTDLIVGTWSRGATERNEAVVFSGRTGRELWRWSHPSPGGFGWNVDGIGDLDADGHDDVLVSAIFENHDRGEKNGSVRVYSGRTGDVLAALFGKPLEVLGAGAAAAGDVDRDGVPDIVVGAPACGEKGFLAGRVEVISGRWLVRGTGARAVHTWDGAGGNPFKLQSGDRLGQRVAGAGDVDGDGWPDVIAGANGANGFAGYARVYSGQTGDPIWTWHGARRHDFFGGSVSGAGDIDGDGHDDLIVMAGIGSSSLRGAIHLYSGRTGDRLHRWMGGSAGDTLVAVAGGRDVDGDGCPDLLVGAAQASMDSGQVDGPGYARVYSGR